MSLPYSGVRLPWCQHWQSINFPGGCDWLKSPLHGAWVIEDVINVLYTKTCSTKLNACHPFIGYCDDPIIADCSLLPVVLMEHWTLMRECGFEPSWHCFRLKQSFAQHRSSSHNYGYDQWWICLTNNLCVLNSEWLNASCRTWDSVLMKIFVRQ